jgi:hypothetical protein
MDSSTTQGSKSPGVRAVLWAIVRWAIPGAGLFLFVALPISPWVLEQMITIGEHSAQVQAQVQSCELVRDGRHRQNAVSCTFRYDFEGKSYTATSAAWTSQNPFMTREGLARQLASESARTTRMVRVETRHPKNARIPDERLLAMPTLWVDLLVLIGAIAALAVRLEPGGRIYKRADLRLDPASGELVEINNDRLRRRLRAAALGGLALLLAMATCAYGLSNRLGNAAAMLALSGLQETPARLVDCGHRYYGSKQGHDQLDCAFEYQVNGQTLRGQADSLDFRFVPTDARMDAQVERMEGKEVPAYVDAVRPGYAWAFLSDEWIVPYTWGVFELMLLLLLVFVLPVLAWITARSARRRD